MSMKHGKEPAGDEVWDFGDDWKQGSPDQPIDGDDIQYVDILRGDTGMGYDDSFLLDLVGYLGSRGVRATYESFAIGMEPAAIKSYVLKVELGKEDEAREYLREKFNAQGQEFK